MHRPRVGDIPCDVQSQCAAKAGHAGTVIKAGGTGIQVTTGFHNATIGERLRHAKGDIPAGQKLASVAQGGGAGQVKVLSGGERATIDQVTAGGQGKAGIRRGHRAGIVSTLGGDIHSTVAKDQAVGIDNQARKPC